MECHTPLRHFMKPLGAGSRTILLALLCVGVRGRGDDGEVISVAEEGLRTDVCVFFLWMGRSQVEREICGWE